MNYSPKILIIIFLIVGYFLSAAAPIFVAHGEDCPANQICLPNPLGSTDSISKLIEKIVNWLAQIGGIIAVGMIIWGAIQMLTAGGNPEKIEKAKKTIFWTVVGYAIILIGKGIETIIRNFFDSS
jgi:hypothetical protein